MKLSTNLDRACKEYFNTWIHPGSIVAGYDVSPRGTSLCFIHEDRSVEFYNVFSEMPPKKIPKTRAPGSVPHIPPEKVHEYALNGIATVTLLKKPAAVVHEEYAFGAKGNAVLDIAELGQDVRRMLKNAPCKYQLLSNTLLKSFIKQTCNGRDIKKMLTKEQMISLLSARFNIYFTNNNEADAFALAFWGMYEFIGDKELKISSVKRILYTPEIFQQSVA